MSEKDSNDSSDNEIHEEIHDMTEDYEYNNFSMVYNLATYLQEYCKQNALPIFNKPNTTSIILDTFFQ